MKDLSETLTAQWKDAVNLILGLWLFVSPWALAYATHQNASLNAWIIGALIVALALAALFAFQQWEEWVSAVFGAWLIVSPWLLEYATLEVAMWNHVIVGAAVAILALWAVMTETGGVASH